MKSVAIIALAIGGCATNTTARTSLGSLGNLASFGPSALAVVQLSPSEDIAEGSYCPEPVGPDDICLGATMFFQHGSIRRVIAGSSDFGGSRAEKFKTIGGHAAIKAKGGIFVALIEQTKSGYTWVPWKEPVRGNTGCIPAYVIRQFSVVLSNDATTEKDGSRCVRI